ncbi:nose resistant to fluoxetine protein 6-like [Argopecten irradians]|uniref:nose resistant to fluoxetine protein 6-like n=1 Tax=Argopecten irradians TaxID=31199 RepID=UPI003720A9CB
MYTRALVLVVLMSCLIGQMLSDTSTNSALTGITHVNNSIVYATSGTTSGPAPPSSGGINSTAISSAGKQLSKYWQALQNSLLQNPQIINRLQKQIGNFIKANNVSFPISILTPENLQKGLQFLGPVASNLQGLSQFAGQLANIPNEIRNFSNGLEENISPQCYDHLQFIVSELMKREQWAIKMIDAAGKIQSGLLDGNLVWTGSYDECLAVHAGRFDGKYCTASLPLTDILGSLIPFPGGVTVKMGICIPDSCTSLESKTVLDLLLGMVPLGKTKLKTSSVECSEPLEYDAVSTAGFVVCGVIGTLMLLSTIFDVVYHQCQKISNERESGQNGVLGYSNNKVDEDVQDKPKKPKQPGILTRLAMSFSVYTNAKKLMSTEQAGGSLGAINGIRFLSISWVVLGHAFAFGRDQMLNQTHIPEFFNDWTSMVIVNGLLSVDSFFTLSGLLVSYLFMKEMKREKGRINWFMFYFHRFWRLTPVYMLVVFLDTSLIPHLGDGPFFSNGGPDTISCRTTWWANLLYINNFVKGGVNCFGAAWYLANDMQFYVVSPLLLVPLYFSKKIGLAVNAFALLVITIATAAVSAHFELLPTLLSTDAAAVMKEYHHYSYDYYMVPWCRMGPYIVGIVAGYIIYRTNGQYKIQKELNLLIWFLIAVLACVVVYGVYGPVNGSQWDNGIAALYNGVHRSVWGLCLCWVIFACVTGNGGIINDFLSWKLFVPLGRLSYCIYLTHVLVLFYYFQTMRHPFYGTNLESTYIFLGSLVLSILTAIVATLAFETPMMVIEKIVFRRDRK